MIAYRDHDLIAEVLGRLSRQTHLPTQVLVVDNGGTLTPSILSELPLAERTVLVSRPDNPGYGAAVNEAREFDSPAVLVLTHDAVFDENLATDLLQALDEDDSRGAAAPVLRFASDPERVFSAGGVLTRGGRALHLTSVSAEQPYPVDWVDGAIVLYQRAALDRIGGLAEEYFLYFEDVDTAWRMRLASLQTVVVPAARAFQQPGAHPMYLGIRNMTLFARKAGLPALAHTGAVLRRIAEESAYRVLHRRSPELGAALRGWRDGRRGLDGKPAA